MPPKTTPQEPPKRRNIYLYAGIVIVAVAVLLIPFSTTVTSIAFEDPYEKLVKQIPKSQYLFSAKSKTCKNVAQLIEFAEENSKQLLPISYEVAGVEDVQQLITNTSPAVNTVLLMSLIFQPLEAHKKLVAEFLAPAKKHSSNVLELKASLHMLTKKEKVNLVLFMPVVITATKTDCEENGQQEKCTKLVHAFSVVAFKDAAGFTFLQVIQGHLPSDKNSKKYTLRDWFMRSKFEPYNQLLFAHEEGTRIPFFQKLEELFTASQVTPEKRRLFEELFFVKLDEDFQGSISLGVLWNDSMGLMNLKEIMEYTEFMKGVVNAKKLK